MIVKQGEIIIRLFQDKLRKWQIQCIFLKLLDRKSYVMMRKGKTSEMISVFLIKSYG